jgi:hypothetical protein
LKYLLNQNGRSNIFFFLLLFRPPFRAKNLLLSCQSNIKLLAISLERQKKKPQTNTLPIVIISANQTYFLAIYNSLFLPA